ncbi:MAG: hypothetical protein K9M98_02970 [Cephaloticoccus sp.]|nr:hypothetical protein [Cephaloticoccus sp.]MCF7759443.1 hypothetical protein [Cephaloticoccus sp.]
MSQSLANFDQTPAVSVIVSQRLHRAGLAALVSVLIYFYWSTGGTIDLSQFLALGTIILASLPALRWARTRCTWFPAFEISMLTYIAFYAVPLFKGQQELVNFGASDKNQASLLVLVYMISTNFGFNSISRVNRAPRWSVESLLPKSSIRWVPIGLFLNVTYAYISIYLDVIPPNLNGTLRALFFGIGIMSTFVLARLWGQEQLRREQVIFFVINMIIYLLLTFSTLYLIGGISTMALALIAYASAKRRIPFFSIGLFLPIVALLHMGKPEMRKIYWDPLTNETRGAPVQSLTDLPAYYSEWIDYSLAALKQQTTRSEEAPSSIFERASLIQMICLSVAEVPEKKPYLYGESYVDIPALFIPRLFWPDKPSSLLANIRLAVYFGLVPEDDTFSVSIAFGPLAEAYTNFGYIGVGILGLIMGIGYKRVSLLSDGLPQFSALGIFMILLTAWSFQVEQVMATWLSSLFQASVICIGLPLAYRKFTGTG